jgi:hypothetical protein
MSTYRQLLDAKAEQERIEFRERQEAEQRAKEKRRESGLKFEALMSTYMRSEFAEFVEALKGYRRQAEYSEKDEDGFTIEAQVAFRLHHDEDRVPLNKSEDCRVWIRLDPDNGEVFWDYQGDLPQHAEDKVQTGKLGKLDVECAVALREVLADCLVACLKGHRLTNLR